MPIPAPDDFDRWAIGDAYQAYVGRWSSLVAGAFVRWLAVPGGRRWLDVGCGTGALTAAILATADPAAVLGVEPSPGFLATASARIDDARVSFRTGTANPLPVADSTYDAVVSGLVLNFVPDPEAAVVEFARVTSPGGVVAAYVWDYTEGMELMRHFWDAAVALAPAASELDEGARFPFCQPEPLGTLWTDTGLRDVVVDGITVPTVFADFDDYWTPFLGGQGPAPGYVASLTEAERGALRESLQARLPVRADGSIALAARAWAVRGVVAPAQV